MCPDLQVSRSALKSILGVTAGEVFGDTQTVTLGNKIIDVSTYGNVDANVLKFGYENPYLGLGTGASARRTGLYLANNGNSGVGFVGSSATAIGSATAFTGTNEGYGQNFATGAVANNNAGMRWTVARFRREWSNYMIGRVSFSSTSDIRVFIGWSSDTAEIAGETTLNNFSGCGVGKRAGDTNWFTYTNDGDATEDRVDTGITFATSEVTIQLQLDGTNFKSRIGATENTAVTTELPAATTMLTPHIEIETGAGAADKTITIFPFYFRVG